MRSKAEGLRIGDESFDQGQETGQYLRDRRGTKVMTRNIRCTELADFAVPGMRIKVRWFPDGVSNSHVWRAPSNILTLSRVVGEPILHRDVSKRSAAFHPAGPLTFWPRSAMWESHKTRNQILTVSTYFDTNLTSAPLETQPEEIAIDDFSMLEMMQILHDEVTMPGLASHELVSAIGEILRIKLRRLMQQRARSPSISRPTRSVDLAMIHGLIHARSGRFPSTAELAAQLNTSRRNLLRLFKATTGVAPSRYIEETRLDRAKTLLATSRMTLKQVAHAAGYSTASYFSTKFHRQTGLTPSAFRRRARRTPTNRDALSGPDGEKRA
jgi:AraC-like DNA-binding protein